MVRVVAVLLLQCGLALAATGQARVILPANRIQTNDKITVRVRNDGSDSITVCVDIEQTSTDGIIVERTPIPFSVQKQSGKRWKTLTLASKFDHFQVPQIIESEHSVPFAFRLDVFGPVRLFLNYWQGSILDLDCSKGSNGTSSVFSDPFMVYLPPEH